MPLRVVIADDDSVIRLLLRRIIEGSVAFVVAGEFADGEAALRSVSREHPDIVLLDLCMPGLDGLAAISRLRECSPDSRIVVLSGLSADRMEQRALDQRADAYIEKGESPARLLDRLLEVLGMRADGTGNGENFKSPDAAGCGR